MHSAEWIAITKASNIPAREGRSVRVRGFDVALFNLGDRFVAVENRCPHLGGPLADGFVSSLGDAVTVTCPLHNWRICIESGSVLKPSAQEAPCIRTFPVKEENGIVMLAA
jgi:nitrite reductase (NADH) small subunit